MILEIEIQDDDLAYLKIQIGRGSSFTLNCLSDDDANHCGRLVRFGIISKMKYYGEELQYNPEYELTNLGKMAMTKYNSIQGMK